jgi:hypothetical protein
LTRYPKQQSGGTHRSTSVRSGDTGQFRRPAMQQGALSYSISYRLKNRLQIVKRREIEVA